jgi:HK97 family phage major capsid protein
MTPAQWPAHHPCREPKSFLWNEVVMPTDIAGSKRLDWLKRQMDQALGEVESITNRAADDDRDLSEAEQRTCEARRSRVAELEDELKVEADLAQRSASYQGLVAHIGPAQDQPIRGQLVERQSPGGLELPTYDTPGKYLVDFLTRSEDPEAAQRFNRYLERAVQHQTTVQNPGLLPTPILGPVFTQQVARRPAIESATLRPLPGSGKTFQRPQIKQYTLAGPQSAEKAELPSRPMLIDPITVTKSTYGGVVNLSWQDRDWTDPSIMDLLVADLAASYANSTDAAFVTYFLTTVTQTLALATADAEGLLGAIFGATGTIFSQTNTMPDTLWVSPDVWGALGAMVDSTGRQMFATVNPVNGLGTISPQSMTGSLAGYRLVIDKNLPSGTAILGDSTYVEVYETVGGQVSAIEPSVLGTQIAFYGYIAWLTLEPKAFVKLTGVPVLPFGSTNGNGGTPAQHSSSSKASKAS